MDRTDENHIPVDVRAAIRVFLSACHKEAKPFAAVEAMDAVRRVFPDLDISDADLMDAITSEASTTGSSSGMDSNSGTGAGSASDSKQKQKSLERWDNEGGATGQRPGTAGRA